MNKDTIIIVIIKCPSCGHLYLFEFWKNVRKQSVLWIQIGMGSDPHHFCGAGSGSASRASRSGSGRSGYVSMPGLWKLINLLFSKV
jgi:hypothetical protein